MDKIVGGRVDVHPFDDIAGPCDDIARPAHYYSARKYEPKDVIRDWRLNFNLGNVVKYVSRAGRKDGTLIIVDLQKAKQYLEFEIEALMEEMKKAGC